MNQILIIQTASIGDVILATAVAEQLHQAFPQAAIDFLLKKGVEPILENHPFMRQILVWDKSKKWTSWRQLLRKIRSQKYDLVVDIQRFMLTGLWTVLSGAKETRGFSKNPCSWFFTKRFPHRFRSGIHEIDRNFSLVADLCSPPLCRPRLYPRNFPEIAQSNTDYYTVSPASLWETKRFPPEKWVELMSMLPEKSPIFLLGGKQDVALCQSLKDCLPNHCIEIKAGTITLTQSAALMSKAKMNYVNDSSPMHLASAMNAPVTAIYCSTTPDFGFGPLSDRSFIVQNDECPCRPCGIHGKKSCPQNHFDCGYKIDNQQFTKTI